MALKTHWVYTAVRRKSNKPQTSSSIAQLPPHRHATGAGARSAPGRPGGTAAWGHRPQAPTSWELLWKELMNLPEDRLAACLCSPWQCDFPESASFSGEKPSGLQPRAIHWKFSFIPGLMLYVNLNNLPPSAGLLTPCCSYKNNSISPSLWALMHALQMKQGQVQHYLSPPWKPPAHHRAGWRGQVAAPRLLGFPGQHTTHGC